MEAILAARAGAAVAPDIARRIASATGGNALAVVELAPLLTREQLAGGEPLPQPLPMSSGVERLFADRVRDLPADARLPLLIAAADDTGRPDAVAAAARRLGSDLAALESAEEAGLVRVEAAEIRFRHPLVRSAIYGTATFAERRAVHRALAETLNDRGEIDRYAWHLAAATLELAGHLLVRLECCRREVPRIPVDLTRIQKRLCERAMDRAPLGEPRGSIDRRADKRMPEADLRRVHADEPGLLCALECRQI